MPSREKISRSNPLPVAVLTRAEGQPAKIGGYGAVFFREGDPSTEYQLWDDMFERIMPGAFDKAIRGDVRSLFNHDANIVLGRTSAGTLALSIDAKGLVYEVTLPDTQLVRDQVLSPIARKEVTGSSFMFYPTDVSYREKEGIFYREINEVELLEVGPVTFPAYEGSTTGVRSVRPEDAAEARAGFDAWREEARAAQRQRDQDAADASAAAIALRGGVAGSTAAGGELEETTEPRRK